MDINVFDVKVKYKTDMLLTEFHLNKEGIFIIF